MFGLKSKISAVVIASIMSNTAMPQNLNLAQKQKIEITDNSKKIAASFAKFNYEMRSQWDGKDVTFRMNAEREFENSISELMAEGVTQEEIQAYVESNMLDSKTRNDYKKLIETIKKQGKDEFEAQQLAANFMQNNEVQGLSLSGSPSRSLKAFIVVIGVVVVGVITYLLIKKCNKPSDNGTTSTTSTTSTTQSSESQSSEAEATSSESSETSSSTGYSDDQSSESSSQSEVTSQESSQQSSTGGCYPYYECYDK
jgi:hypothetical protein